ncbi:RHS repeat-associated core domain-containing protein [Erwiniaceae bacterium CAU 1747]
MKIKIPVLSEDNPVGLHYNRHRYYDPHSGRYITQDPIGLLDGMNSYGYVSNSPLNRIDHTGLNGLLNSPGLIEKASLGSWMMKNRASAEEISEALSPRQKPPVATGECR